MDKNTKINIILLVLISISAAMAVYSSYTESHITGPTSIVMTNKGNVIIAMPEKFISLDINGKIVQQNQFHQLGISGPIEDMQALSDGKLIVGDGGQRKLLSCNEMLTTCRELVGIKNHYDIGQFHKFYVDEQANRILLVNTEKHELVSLDLNGNLLNTLIDKTSKLKFPSGLYYLGDDQLMITSSLNHHIYQYNIAGVKAKEQRLINVDAVAIYDEKYLPINITRTDNHHWWVVAKGNQLVGSSLLEYDENWKFKRVIGNKEMLHPYDILSLGKWILITDLYGIDLLAYNEQGQLLNKFGEPLFYDVLKNAKNVKQIASTAKYASIGLLLVLLCVALVLDKMSKKTIKNIIDSENKAVRNDGDGSLVFEIHPKTLYLKLLRIMPVILITILTIPIIFLRDSSPETLTTMMISFIPIFIIIVSVTSIVVRHFPKKIRVENHTLTITNYQNKEVSMLVQDIVYSNNVIWMGNNYYSLGKKGVLIEINEDHYRLFNLLEQSKQEKKRKLLVKTVLADKWFFLALVAAFFMTQNLDGFMSDSEMLEKETEIINDLQSRNSTVN